MSEKKTGRILEIQRMSTEDGPGLRTTVFLKGCTLKCSWCHNPESIDPSPEISWTESACIGCRTCIEICEATALKMDETGLAIDRGKCTKCCKCTEECPAMAIVINGETWTAEALVAELIKDRAFFENSEGGGITLSGGEMTMQTDFCAEILKDLCDYGIHTAIDTCGQCSEKALEKLLPYTDLVLFDLKEMNPAKHKEFTGKSNETILENVKFTADWIRNNEKPETMWIRTPIIPDATMNKENIPAMGEFIGENLKEAVSRWELCTFNNLCRDKYSAFGIRWKHENAELLKSEEITTLADVAKSSGVDPAIVHWSGSTRQ